MSNPRKTTRIQRKKFDNIDEMLQYYDDNTEEIHSYTLNRLEDYWYKNKKIGDIDIYKVDIYDSPNIAYMSILPDEWEEALFNIEVHFVTTENYLQAARVRDFSWEIFGKTEIGEDEI